MSWVVSHSPSPGRSTASPLLPAARAINAGSWAPLSALLLLPAVQLPPKYAGKQGEEGKKNKIRLSPFVKLCLSKH